MKVDLSHDELSLLTDLLKRRWDDLRVEIRRTETSQFQDELRQVEHLTVALLQKLDRAEKERALA